DNDTVIHNGSSIFPPHILVPYNENKDTKPKRILPEYFTYEGEVIDLELSRLKAPVEIICNLTLQCVTSCVYCYADRKGNQNKKMSLDLIKKIISEAHEMGVVRFKLMGGEVLLYPHWEAVVRLLTQYGYQPDISIKKPLTEDEIIKWKALGATKDPIQISLDTLIESHLINILKVTPDYFKKIKETFILLDKHQIPYVVHTVLNRYNDSVEDMQSLYEFFKERTSLQGWMIDAAKCSMYNGLPYADYRARSENTVLIREYIKQINTEGVFNFKIKAPIVLWDFNKLSSADKEKIFNKRHLCSGNLCALYILPDGKVTICEELYWHPHFILGDLNHHTLQEIWDSPKAKELFYLKQSDIPQDSPCSNCEDFTSCRKYRHICWRDTILAYGKDKWYYPDMACPKAPQIPNDISMQ
ncbi:MAG: radical SAM protein, partial [Muribaculaceae bacterium]|nr:radical SAM protein [Muribaculaceae bacterium]